MPIIMFGCCCCCNKAGTKSTLNNDSEYLFHKVIEKVLPDLKKQRTYLRDSSFVNLYSDYYIEKKSCIYKHWNAFARVENLHESKYYHKISGNSTLIIDGENVNFNSFTIDKTIKKKFEFDINFVDKDTRDAYAIHFSNLIPTNEPNTYFLWATIPSQRDDNFWSYSISTEDGLVEILHRYWSDECFYPSVDEVGDYILNRKSLLGSR